MQVEEAVREAPRVDPKDLRKNEVGTYAYRVRTSQGVMVRGKVRAYTAQQATHLVTNPGDRVVKLKRTRDLITLGSGYRKVKPDELVLFAQQLGAFISAGVPLIDALSAIGSESSSRLMQDTTRDLAIHLAHGRTLSEALRHHPKVFPSTFVDLVRAGETSGDLDTVLDRASEYLERQNEAKMKIRSALAYPAVIMVVAIVTVIVLVSYVLPKFVVFFENFNAELPLPTRMLINLADWFEAYWLPLAGAILFLIVAAWLYLRTPSGRFARDRMLLKLPGLGPVMRFSIVERFCANLSMLVKAGVPIVSTFNVLVEGTGNEVFRRGLRKVQEQMMSGMGMSTPIAATGLFPREIPQMMKVGEASGTVDEQLEIASKLYGKKLDYRIKRFTAIFEPMVIVIMGVLVGFVAIALVSAMYGVFSQLKEVKGG